MPTAAERLNSTLAGRYRVERELGTGGMATVYLAHDERHARKVALKVLRPELAAVIGAERFLNEIRTTANLQHPHIVPLHDSGEVDGTAWYVMPLIEGESLRDRLNRETQLPVDDALQIAREVAGALDYAHRRGVIHRDIKPDNILLHDGRAVVADFGIALAISRTDGGARLTETGMSLGTPHYMSPEQAMGDKSIDARTDVYALGVVLYEMLVGEPPFTGPSAQAIVAKVMSARPADIASQRPTVPTGVEDAVLRALSKLPADRFRSAADFAGALHAAMTSGFASASRAHSAPPVRETAATFSTVVRAMRVVPWALATIAVVIAVVALARGRSASIVPVTAAVLPLEIRTPTNLPLNEVGNPISVASDGSFIIFVGPDPDVAGATALWRRPLDRLDAAPIPGTRGAQSPRVLRDGRTLSFFRRAADNNGNDRMEVALDGSIPVSAPTGDGVLRLRDGRVLYADDTGIVLAPAGRARAQSFDMLAMLRRPPSLPPSEKWIARSVRSALIDSIVLISFEPRVRHAIAAGVAPKFLDEDILAFCAPDGTLYVGRLRGDRSGFIDAPIPIVAGVSLSGSGDAIYDVARDGTLIYAPGTVAARSRLTWVRNGEDEPVPGSEFRVHGGVVLSPDGRRAALSVGGLTGIGDVWVTEVATGATGPLTSDGMSTRPAWRPSGKSISYLHDVSGTLLPTGGRGGTPDSVGVLPRVATRIVNGSGFADSLRGPWPPGLIDEVVWSPDDRHVAIRVRQPAVGRDIIIREVDGDSLRPFAAEAAQERGPRFSPDGKWLLYVSDRSGRDEVYAESFPGGGNRVQLSADGGREAVWARDGSTVFYRGLDGWMMAARLTRGGTLQVAGRDRLFDASPYLSNQYLVMYDVAADGRFLMFRLDEQPTRTDVVIIRNWVEQVRARLDTR